MSIITAIKQQRHKNRVNIYLDGKFEFGLDLENYMKLKLKVEQELTKEEVEKIKSKGDFQKTLNYLLNFAMRRPRSRREFEGWMKRKRVPENFHKGLFNKLKKLQLLDDHEFARWWVDQRNSFRPRSKRLLIQELRLKGIDKDIINDVLAETQIDEVKIAKELVETKAYKWERLEPLEKKKKKSEFLARKGFSWDIIKAAVNLTEGQD